MASKLTKIKDIAGEWWQATRREVRDKAYMATTPYSPRIDDTFLVEFPKSGVTWLTFLIASINLQKSGIDRRPTFFGINDLVPDIHTSRHLPPPLPFPGHRFIKSHAPYNPLYSKVIYLVRDPRDVMVSYHAFASKLGWYHGSLSDLVRDRHYGIDAWVHHAQSWLTNTKPGVSFSVVRYEDLYRDTESTLRQIYTLFGYSIEQQIMEKAIENASFQEMRENEVFYNSSNPTLPDHFAFVRKGGSSHKENLSSGDVAFIISRAEGIMKVFGYV